MEKGPGRRKEQSTSQNRVWETQSLPVYRALEIKALACPEHVRSPQQPRPWLWRGSRAGRLVTMAVTCLEQLCALAGGSCVQCPPLLSRVTQAPQGAASTRALPRAEPQALERLKAASAWGFGVGLQEVLQELDLILPRLGGTLSLRGAQVSEHLIFKPVGWKAVSTCASFQWFAIGCFPKSFFPLIYLTKIY